QMPDLDATGLTFISLLGALAFAGAGGSTNLGQSNFIKDKGYGMGQFIGRITSPLTGQQEAIAGTGFLFPDSPENRRRWLGWWRSANIEHLLSFFVTCVICLCLMSLMTYSVFYDADGVLKPGMDRYGAGLDFVWGEATIIGERAAGGGLLKLGFLVMGIAVLLTTELGVLDATARISTDIVKINYLRDNDNWSLSKLYYLFLWGEILLGTLILLVGFNEPLVLLVTSAAMNGFVMFVYSILLLVLNGRILPSRLRMGWFRMLAIGWAVLFFGFFSYKAVELEVWPKLFG
ncbi:MAG: Nramp family divalent metal transporter, partial [Planctomycetota bacterium]|nr:Nramp family divalent metal transporter [Planctomycetota bacterium]